jgi:hypothetical protein
MGNGGTYVKKPPSRNRIKSMNKVKRLQLDEAQKYTTAIISVKPCLSVYFHVLDRGVGYVHTTYDW